MEATTNPEKVVKQEEDLNKRLLYRAYDLILSWPVVETAVSDSAGEKGTLSPGQQKSN